MEGKNSQSESREAETSVAQAMLADLRLRLHGSQEQERAARAAVRRLAREVGLTRRLLAFSYGAETPMRNAYRQPPAGEIPRVRATALTTGAVFHLDSCLSSGTHVVVAGWAFMPVPGWNGPAATVTVLFRHGLEAYAAAAGRMLRSDVAAHFAIQPDEAAGGARGLTGAGFACEIDKDSLPPGVEWEIVLRLECAGLACEQPTGQRLRL